MPIDRSLLESAEKLRLQADQGKQLYGVDTDLLSQANEQTKSLRSDLAARRTYFREKYANALTAPLHRERVSAQRATLKEVIDPEDRKLLLEDMAVMAQLKSTGMRKKRAEAGYGGRFIQDIQKPAGAFADAGSRMIESQRDLAELALGKQRSPEDVSFMRDLESTNQEINPNVSQIDSTGILGSIIKNKYVGTQAIATGVSGMAPDAAAGMLALIRGGVPGSIGYWMARTAAEKREDFVELGLDPGLASTLAGGTVAAATGALENIIKDPTGFIKTGGVVQPLVKKISQAVGKKVGRSLIAKQVAKKGTEAAFRGFGELVLEEGSQGATEETAKFLAGELSENVQRRDPMEILRVARESIKEATPGIIGLVGIGAGGQASVSVQRARQLTKGSAKARIESAIMKAANEGATVSRKQWRKWGLPSQRGGMSRADRASGIKEIGSQIQVRNQVETLVSGRTPTEEQWKEWDFPAKEGQTPKSRKEFLFGKFDEALTEEETEITSRVGQEVATAPEALEGVPSRVEAPEAIEQPLAATEVAPSPIEGELSVAEGVQTPPISTIEVSEPPTQEARGVAPIAHDFPSEEEGTGEAVSARAASRKIEKIWAVPTRRGKIKGAKVRGLFKPRERLIRMQKGEESSPAVQIHEVAHSLDKEFDLRSNITRKMRTELANLDYDQKARRTSEGIAEFVRAYVSGGASVAGGGAIDLGKVAPKFLEKFEAFLSENPDIKKSMEKTKEIFTELSKAGAIGRVKGQVSKTGFDVDPEGVTVPKIKEMAEQLYTKFKDEGRAIQRYSNDAEGNRKDPSAMEPWELALEWKNIEGNEDAQKLPSIGKMESQIKSARKMSTTAAEDFNALRKIGPHFAATALQDGVFSLVTMRKIGPSLREALADIEQGEDYDNFVAWMYARHAIESWAHKKNPGIKLSDAKSTEEKLRSDRYIEAAGKVTKFNNSLITMLQEVGVIDAKAEKKILKFYENYIPLERATERKGFLTGKKLVNLGKAIKGRRGSGLQIIDPLEASMSRAVRLYERGAKQLVVNKIVKTYSEVGGLGGWITEVSPDVKKVTFKAEQIKLQIAEMFDDIGLGDDAVDVLLDSIDPEAMMSVWKPEMMQVNGSQVVRVTIDGKPRLFELHPDLMESLGGIESMETLGFVTKVFKSATSVLKIGATRANVDFFVTNGIKDYQTFLMQGTKGLKGALDPARYMVAYATAEIAKLSGQPIDPVVALFDQMGGNLSTYVGLDRDRLKGGIERALTGKQSKFETALNIAGAPEIAGRLAEFATILDKHGWLEKAKSGEVPPRHVLIRAINAAHDVTVDFRRMGTIGRKINYFIPFFNARLEGLDKTIRTFKDHPGQTIARIISTRLPIAILYWWYRHDDDDYKERPEWQDQYYMFKIGGQTLRVPRPHEWGLIDSGMERMLDAMHDKDPEQIERWAKQSISTMHPGGLPSGVTPFVEAFFNYSTFKGRKIVSDNLSNLEKPDQYYEHTSGIAKEASRLLHAVTGGAVSLSPAKLDYIADGLTGSAYTKLVSFTKKVAQSVTGRDEGGWVPSDVPGLKGVTLRKEFHKSVDDFYKVRNKIEAKYNSANKRGEATEKLKDDNRFVQNIGSLMGKIRSAARELSRGDRVKAEAALAGLARLALERKPLDSYRNPVNNLDNLPASIRKVVAEHIGMKAVSATSGKDFGDTQRDASEYLEKLGVKQIDAEKFAFKRLRSGMRSVKSSRKQANRIRGRL